MHTLPSVENTRTPALTPVETELDGGDADARHLELETARSHDLVGPYGAFVATMAPEAPLVVAPPPAERSDVTAAGIVERTIDVLAVLPISVWSRVALYSFLTMLFGNLLRCGGLSASANLTFAFFVVLGLAGVGASAQRSP
ncbi:MAG: hypothetical protein JWP87_4438 [Labilithrix sp.]|nr:hypothetical protein [Labilithrix sp.]